MIHLYTLIRNRKDILPYFLQSIINFNYPKEKIKILFLVNNNDEEQTMGLLEQFKHEFDSLYKEIHIMEIRIPDLNNLPSQSRVHGNPEGHKVMMKSLGFLRSIALDYVKESGQDYLLSIDSDVMLEPEGINKLKSARFDHTAAKVFNDASSQPEGVAFDETRNKFRFINAGITVGKDKSGKKLYRSLSLKHPNQGSYTVEIIGACFLSDLSLVPKKADYLGEYNWGEDSNFCEKIDGNIGIDLNIETVHLMESHEGALAYLVKEGNCFGWWKRNNRYRFQ